MEINMTLTDDEVTILLHDILDIDKWVAGAVRGKINACKARAAKAYRDLLIAEGSDLIPASDDAAARALFNRPDYKNRAARDQEQES